MKTKITLWSILVLVVLFCCFPIRADMLTGEISGTVVDENGEFLPGAELKLTGERLFQKSATVTANEKGGFRFINLNPGSYELNVTLTGFNSVKIPSIKVSVGQTASIRAVMGQAKVAAEVTITAAAPLIETKTTQISTNFSIKDIANLPTTRNMIDLTEAVPGLNDRGAYGAGGDSDWNYVYGSNTSNYTFNGVDIASISRGDVWVSPSYETIDEIQVVGIGATAEYGNFSGASINVVTKSGTNKVTGGIALYYSDSSLFGDNSKGIEDLTPPTVKYNPDSVAWVGGPIIKEKLFFFLSGGYTTKKAKNANWAAFATLKQPHYQGRIDWLATPNHTFTLMVNSDPLDHDNLGLLPNSGPEVAYTNRMRDATYYGSWQWLIGADAFLNIKYAGFKGRVIREPVSPDTVSIRDYSKNRRYGSSGISEDSYSYRDQVNANASYYADDLLGMSHEFKFGLEYEKSKYDENIVTTGKGGLIAIYPYPGGNYLFSSTVGYYMHQLTKLDRVSAFVQDNVSIGTKLTANLGLRYDAPKMSARGISGTIASYSNLAPRIGLSYDLFGNAKDVIHAHYGRYYEKMTTFGFSQSAPGMQDISYYQVMTNEPFNPTPENIANLPALLNKPENFLYTLTAGTPMPVLELKGPHTDVFNIGYEKLLFGNFALAVEYIHKRDRDFLLRGTNTSHTFREFQWTEPYTGKTITLYDQVDSTPDDWYLGNSKWAKRNHDFFMVTLRKRESDNWSMMASFTYQKTVGNVSNTSGEPMGWYSRRGDQDPNYFKNPLRWGEADYNRKYQFKVVGSYLLPWGFSISADLRILSGRNWTPITYNFYAPLTTTAGFLEIPLEKRGSRVMPTTKMLNFRLAKDFRIAGWSRLALILDILNAFNDPDAAWYDTTPFGIYAISGVSSFGKPVEIGLPRRLQLGIRWTF